MKITNATRSIVFYVETDESELNRYTRHSSENWSVTMGQSDEVVYDCEEMEKLFQEWFSQNGNN
jgi:hypothetical protein